MENGMVTVKALRPLLSPYFGKRAAGRVFECKREHYEHMKKDLELVESKELKKDSPQVESKEIHKEQPRVNTNEKGKWKK